MSASHLAAALCGQADPQIASPLVVVARPRAQIGAGSRRTREKATTSAPTHGQPRGKVQGHPPPQAGEATGDVQQPVAQALWLRRLSREHERAGVGDEVLGAQRQLEPHGVWTELAEGEGRKAAGAALADAVLDARVRAVASLERGEVGALLVGMRHVKRWPSWSVNESWAPGRGRSRRQMRRVPLGHSVKSSTESVSSQTAAASRAQPSWSIA